MNKMTKQLFLSFSLLICALIGRPAVAVAANNAPASELQQLQALQQQIPQSPPVRQSLQLSENRQASTNNLPTASATPTNTPPPGTTPPPPNSGNLPVNPPPIAYSPTNTAVPPSNNQIPFPQTQPSEGAPTQPVTSFTQQAPITTITNNQLAAQSQAFQAPFVPPGNPTGDSDISQAAFNSMVSSTLPMTPDQIHRLKQLFTATQFAQAAPPGIPPRPVATSQIVNLAPGATPPVIRLAQGFVTSLVFIDSTGAPWPIDSYSIGDPQRFNIQWNKTDNTLMIQAMSLYNYGNLAVRLKGLVTPVMLTLIPGQKDIDYRVDLRIQGLGPNAAPIVGEYLPSSANPILLGVLDGVPPPGSKELSVCGADFQAWLLGDKMYVRTHFTILSPAWRATMSSADGTKAYEMQKTPMLLISLHGKAVPIKIEGL